ncbi:unnamed protein product [Caenorhabditis angaria]|uniref:Phosphoglycerate mutase family protein n=1 Tax=Caenorhabditis angaria TaxID=860376 RepID=A0A9P1N5U7_9PELO|nr:unnamed protein product [Caenorhabditis angaria]
MANKSEMSEIGSYRCPSNRDHTHSSSEKSSTKKTNYISADILMVMRHSERLNDCCPGYIEKFERKKYEPYDLNMPSKLPIERPIINYSHDTCLTRSGIVLSQMVGRSMNVVGQIPDIIYCSPSLRCIQTATWVREMSGTKTLIRVEPGLFEDFIYPSGVPAFITSDQRSATFPVDNSYKPIKPLDTIINHQETNDEYNDRVRTTLQEIVNTFEVVENGRELRVLCVAHASTVDMAVGLMRERPRKTNANELESIAITVPYCSVSYLKKKKSYWVPHPHIIPTVTYENLNNRYNPYYVHRT